MYKNRCSRYQSLCTGVASHFYFLWAKKIYFKVLIPSRLVENCKSVTLGNYFHKTSTPELSRFQEYIRLQGGAALVIGYLFKEVTTGPVDTQVQQFCHSHHNEMSESGASHLTAQLLLQPQWKGSSVSIECCQGSGLGSCSPRTYKHSSILRLPRHSTSFSYQLFHTCLLVTPWALVFETQSSQSVLQSFFFNFSSF